jgi:hypothetical protein
MEKCPQLAISTKEYVAAPATIAAIGPGSCIILCAGHVFTTRTAMSRLAEDAYVIYKIRFFHPAKVR